MDESAGVSVYRSPIPYEAARINAAAVYCSDGRIGDHMDEFLHQALGLPRYDRVSCPGGPVALAGRLLAFWESRGVLDQLRFLVEVHAVRLVVLIAHEACAYYGERLRLDPTTVREEQRADLVAAASAVQGIDPALEVGGFLARLNGTEVSFERAFASASIDARLRQLPTPAPATPHAATPTSAASPTSPLERLAAAVVPNLERALADKVQTALKNPSAKNPGWVRPAKR